MDSRRLVKVMPALFVSATDYLNSLLDLLSAFDFKSCRTPSCIRYSRANMERVTASIESKQRRARNRGWYCDTYLRLGRWSLAQYNAAMGTKFKDVEEALRAARAGQALRGGSNAVDGLKVLD